MSSADLSPKRLLVVLSLLAAALPLSGCLQPMYGPLSENGNVAGELQAIAIEPIPDRIGHYLGNELHFAFNGTGSQVPPKYRLIITVRETVQTPLIDTVGGRASAGTVLINADYRLMPAGGGEPITKGSAFVAASYDRTSQRFANLRAARDAEIRDAKTLADQIRTRIAASFGTRGS
jgi:LPS-assembly lipoprotein